MIKEAVILAGGLGTRLNAAVSDLPKPMAPVGGKPFLEYLLTFWRDQGVERFVLSVSHMHEKISEHFGTDWNGIEIAYSVEATPLGTGGAIAQALKSVRGPSAWVANGDTYVEVDLPAMAEFHARHGAALTIAAAQVGSTERYSPLEVAPSGKLGGFSPKGNDAPGQINAGVYCVEKKIFTRRPAPATKFSWEVDYLPELLKTETPIFVYPAGDRFLDIGIPEDYARAREFLLN